MPSMQKLIAYGHLSKEPEITYSQAGKAIARLSVPVKRKWKDGEETEWLRCVAFGKTAEIIEKYTKKGSLVYIEGHLKTNKWTDKEGITRYSTDVIVDTMQMLSGWKDEEEQHKPYREEHTGGVPEGHDDGSDIPF